MAKALEEVGIPVTVIAVYICIYTIWSMTIVELPSLSLMPLFQDLAVGYIIEKIDFVLVGAEAVVESGGIVNTVREMSVFT